MSNLWACVMWNMFVFVASMHVMHSCSSFLKPFSRNLSKELQIFQGIMDFERNIVSSTQKLWALRKLAPSVVDPLMGFPVVNVVPLSSSKEVPKLIVLAEILHQRSTQDWKGIYFSLAHKDHSPILQVFGRRWWTVRSKRNPSYISHTKATFRDFQGKLYNVGCSFWSLSPRHGTLFGLCIWIDDTVCLIL